MKESPPGLQNYHENYHGWDIRLMTGRLRRMEAASLLSDIREMECANFLVLGSATPNNLQYITRLDEYVRPGKVNNDNIFIIDQSLYTLQRHQRAGEQSGPEGILKNALAIKAGREARPKFNVAAGDMRQLPFADSAMNVVLSDYTFNFLDNIPDIKKSFEEIARILTEEGIVFISVEGNPDYPFSGFGEKPVEKMPIDDKPREMQGGPMLHAFPLDTYMALAEQSGLSLEKYDTLNKDICCVMKKRVTTDQR